jgi:outer membrane protein OmpA-like peptidoglycan-associated protein
VPYKLKLILKVLVILIILLPAFSLAKTFGNSTFPATSVYDSLVFVSGHIQDSITGLGIGNVIITYRELPYGNFIGIVKSRENDGYYSYKTFGHEAYIIEIRSEEYIGKTDTLSPFLHQGNQIKRNYILSKNPAEEIISLDNLIFDLGKSEIKPESFQELDDLAHLMKANPEMIIQLEGHTDFRGGRSKNLKLSQERVKQVKNYLIHGGIMPDRILTKAFGGSNPLSWENTEEASRLNRRVEVRIISR